jgi:hypothetical protein
VIDCAGPGKCDGQDLICPPDYDCQVNCNGVDACDTGSVTCPNKYSCTLICDGGNDACGDLDLTCGSGSCNIECNEIGACTGTSVQCGAGVCKAQCTDKPVPEMLDCDKACKCQTC